MFSEDDLLDLSGLQHLSYCPRQWALIHLDSIWAENLYTIRGVLFHERAHTDGYTVEHGVVADRGMYVRSLELGISGIADIVEHPIDEPAKLVPVEYKVGKPKTEDWDRIQVCAQAICLEEMFGGEIEEGALFYGKIRRRERIPFSSELRERVTSLCWKMHAIFESGVLPKAELSGKCKRCSLADVCMPESSSVSAAEYWNEAGERLVPLP